MPLIAFAPYLPDLPPRDNPGALEAKNVIPKIGSYGPFPDFTANTDALTARCQGAFSCRDLAGNVHNFAGDATKLYKLASSGLTWSDVSRTVGGAYAVDTANGWSFTQFGNYVIAVNGTDVPQYFQLGVSTNFALLTGSPPTGRFIATVREFVVIGRVSSLFNEVRWSAFNDPLGSWAISATTEADLQDIADGGQVMGIIGGPAMTVFQRNGITRGTYIGGDFIFQFDKISRSIGAAAENSIAAFQNDSFFRSDDGMWRLAGGTELMPIGDSRINQTLLDDLDPSYPHREIGAIDPQRSLYFYIYPGTGNNGGTPNKGWVFHWPSDRWARFELDLEFVYAAQSQSGYTLDTLDTPMPSIDGVPQISLDSPIWSGSGRVVLGGFNTLHKQGFFSGPALAVTVDTGEFALNPGYRTRIRSVRPICDGGGLTVTAITRNKPTEAPVVGSPVAANAYGACPLNSNARYHRARVQVAAGGTWQHLHGIDDIEASRAGKR